MEDGNGDNDDAMQVEPRPDSCATWPQNELPVLDLDMAAREFTRHLPWHSVLALASANRKLRVGVFGALRTAPSWALRRMSPETLWLVTGITRLALFNTLYPGHYLRTNAELCVWFGGSLRRLTLPWCDGSGSWSSEWNLISDTTLARLTRLETLRVPGSPFITLGGIVPLVNLTRLDIRCSGIAAESLSRLSTLVDLRLDQSNSVTDDALRLLPVSLKTLTLHYVNSGVGRGLSALTNLDALCLRQCINFRFLDLRVALPALKKLTLVDMHLGMFQEVTHDGPSWPRDEVVIRVAEKGRSRYPDAEPPPLCVDAMHLRDLARLPALTIIAPAISNAHMLTYLTSLTRLDIYYSKQCRVDGHIQGAMLEMLRAALPLLCEFQPTARPTSWRNTISEARRRQPPVADQVRTRGELPTLPLELLSTVVPPNLAFRDALALSSTRRGFRTAVFSALRHVPPWALERLPLDALASLRSVRTLDFTQITPPLRMGPRHRWDAILDRIGAAIRRVTVLESTASIEPVFFARLPNLVTLRVPGVRQLGDEALLYLPKLKTLDAHNNCSVTSEGVSLLTCLTSLNIRGTRVAVSALCGLTALTELRLSGGNGVTADTVAMLPAGLRKLAISNVSERFGCGLASLTNLEELSLASCRGMTYADIAALPRLRKLTLRYMGCDMLRGTHAPPPLTELTFYQFSEALRFTCDALLPYTQLCALTIVSPSPDALLELTRLTTLTYLDIYHSPERKYDAHIAHTTLCRLRAALPDLRYFQPSVYHSAVRHVPDATDAPPAVERRTLSFLQQTGGSGINVRH